MVFIGKQTFTKDRLCIIKEIIQIGSVLSASSYKQKAGRGAREGNMTDGLFAMSIINESPVSYFHFKHFERLITTSLDPLRLEIKNQNVVVGHCFLSIFDFFASKSINLFRLKPGADYLPTDEVVQQYSNALAELDKSEIKNFLTNFLDIMKADNKDAKVLIDYAKKFLKKLSERHDLTVAGQPENRTLHEWLVRAAVELPTFKQVQNSNFVPTAANEKLDADRTIKGELEKLDESFSKLYPQDDSLKKSIIKFREESK